MRWAAFGISLACIALAAVALWRLAPGVAAIPPAAIILATV
jgi:hypothetical protein